LVKLDGLVNNAYPRTKDWGSRFEDIPYESWKKNVDLQLNTALFFAKKYWCR
jgi:NAD(P)-dependent dehydrogenase (short-subunit alcohol dehydrogenase family)